jgi:fluoride exporter
MPQNLLALSIGAVIGGVARFLITHFFSEMSHHTGFPLGTLLVNVAGSFIVGYVLATPSDHLHDAWRIFAATGFCGAFTTFSAFAFETVGYYQSGRFGVAALNVLLNNALAFVSVIGGMTLRVRG